MVRNSVKARFSNGSFICEKAQTLHLFFSIPELGGSWRKLLEDERTSHNWNFLALNCQYPLTVTRVACHCLESNKFQSRWSSMMKQNGADNSFHHQLSSRIHIKGSGLLFVCHKCVIIKYLLTFMFLIVNMRAKSYSNAFR